MNTENKKYIDGIKRGEELDDGSKEVPRTTPSSLDSSKLSSLFVMNLNVCMRVIDDVCVCLTLLFYRVKFRPPLWLLKPTFLSCPQLASCSSCHTFQLFQLPMCLGMVSLWKA